MKINRNIAYAISELLENAVEENYTIKQFISQVQKLDNEYIEGDVSESTQNLIEQRKQATTKNEYQKITYALKKQNKGEIKTLSFGDEKMECITNTTFYINILKYSKIPAKEFLTYYKNFVVFISEYNDCDFCLFESVLFLLKQACNNAYKEAEIRNMLEQDNFNIFITPADFMRVIKVSSTKSLRIRIDRYNRENTDQIIPFNFYVKGETQSPKVLYLKKDLNKLLNQN